MQIWQSVMESWKLNSWGEVNQLGRADHTRGEKGPKRATVGVSTVGKNVLLEHRGKMGIINRDLVVISISVVVKS